MTAHTCRRSPRNVPCSHSRICAGSARPRRAITSCAGDFFSTCSWRGLAWGAASVPAAFDAEQYFRALLERSFSGEIRPERGGRIDALFGAQREVVLRVYDALLQQLARERILAFDGKVYRVSKAVGALRAIRTGLYFRESKVRATARWAKYVVLYDDWLEYVVGKIARRSGVTLELTARERRWPLIFLWPKAIQYLRSRPQRRPDQ